MTVFGRKLSDYIRFQRVVLILVAVVGVLRLVLSLAGVPNGSVKWLSMTVIAAAAIFYYGVRVYTSGFGSYKQILPLLVIQNTLVHGIVILGILLTIFTGRANIFTAPEYGGAINQWAHIGAHIGIGVIAFSLVGWAIASLVMLVTKRVAAPPVPRAAT